MPFHTGARKMKLQAPELQAFIAYGAEGFQREGLWLLQNESAIATCAKKQQPAIKTGRKRSQNASFAAGSLCIVFREGHLQQPPQIADKRHVFSCRRKKNETQVPEPVIFS
jgi:hypothetical protein